MMATRDDLAGRDLDSAYPEPNDVRRGVRRTSRSTPIDRRVPPPDRAELAPIPARETRPAAVPQAFTHGGMDPLYGRFDGRHVKVVRVAGTPHGSHEDSELSQPQRPTFRAPPEPWTDPLIED